MCGIAGLLGEGVHHYPGLLAAMGTSLRHRGPDGDGLWSDGAVVGLVHRRLAILDLTDAGLQPMASRDGRWLITFNGEIYNHRALRAELEAQTSRNWRGHSDTEVLVEAIAAFGVEDALQRCEGMFALAVWDMRDRRLHLARDRFGEKPLYVGWVGKDIVFASELRALRQHPAWRHAVEPRGLNWYFQMGYVPAPWSIHPGVYKLPAATLLTLSPADAGVAPGVEDFCARLRHYWSMEGVVASARAEPWRGTHEEAMSAVQAALDASVRDKMLADVPVGALLSGGIDSTLVVSSMARQSAMPIRTFTVGFDAVGMDESEPAARTAEFWGTDHHRIALPGEAALSLVDRISEVYDEPFADAAQLPALMVSQVLRSQVKVALTGDGGDELFQGYQRHLDAARNWSWLGRMPAAARRGLAATLGFASGMVARGGLAEGFRRQAWRIGAPDLEGYGKALMTFVAASPATGHDPVAWPGLPAALANASPGACLRWLDQAFALPEGINTKLDRASMSTGLELRAPFLDTRLFALAWRLPEDWLVGGGKGKRILRELAISQSPRGTAARPKQGFDVPLARWLRGPLRQWAHELLAPESLETDPNIDARRVRDMLQQHMTRRADYGHALWAVLMYRSWMLRHG